MISDYYEWWQVPPEDLGGLLAHRGDLASLVLLPLLGIAVSLRRLPRNLTTAKKASENLDLIIDRAVLKTVPGEP